MGEVNHLYCEVRCGDGGACARAGTTRGDSPPMLTTSCGFEWEAPLTGAVTAGGFASFVAPTMMWLCPRTGARHVLFCAVICARAEFHVEGKVTIHAGHPEHPDHDEVP